MGRGERELWEEEEVKKGLGFDDDRVVWNEAEAEAAIFVERGVFVNGVDDAKCWGFYIELLF